MIQRIKTVFFELGVSQTSASETLDVAPSYLSRIMNGKQEINDAFVWRFCCKFKVNEDWLRSGKGEIFIPQSREIDENDVAERYLLNKIDSLPPDVKKQVLRFCSKLLQDQAKNF
ncbi:MAG: helix-turn-helix transcriptional regulator [Thermoguttaceae bacterium]|nr:helix-turn-helix transcriptional regulator [Thermoguttaceae bacterium]